VNFRSLHSHKQAKNRFLTLFTCASCHAGVVAEIRAADSPHAYHGNLADSSNFEVVTTYPTPKPVEVPGHLPENLQNFYLQAAKLMRLQLYDAAAMMCRKILELATRLLDPQIGGKIFPRVEKLEEVHLITREMKEWAKTVSLDSDWNAEEDKAIDEAAARQLLSFTELFLMHTFTLPGMLKNRRRAYRKLARERALGDTAPNI
jgi:hypothetical protein